MAKKKVVKKSVKTVKKTVKKVAVKAYPKKNLLHQKIDNKLGILIIVLAALLLVLTTMSIR